MAYTEAGKFNTRITLKHDTEANWVKAKNFIPLEGEIIIYDADENYSYQRIKIGDGITKVNVLPFDNTQGDWSQNDKTASDYVKNRTHYIETPQGKNVLECSIASHFTWGADSSPNLSAHGVSVNMPTVGEIMHAVVTVNGISRRFSGTLLKNSFDEMWIGDASKLSGVRYPGNEGEFDFAFVVAPPSYFECYFPIEGFGTIAEGDIVNIHLYTGDPTVIIHQLDEKYIPETIARKSDIAEQVQPDWNQNDETAANYIQNRTHYIEENKTVLTRISLDGYKTYSGSTGAEEWKIEAYLSDEEIATLRTLLNDNDCYLEYSAANAYDHKICKCSSNDPSREFTITLEDGYEITIGFGPEAEIPFNSPDQLPETLKTAIELSNDDTWEGGFSFDVCIFQKEKIQKLDSKFLPIPSDCFQPIDLFRKLNITSSSAKNWPISDEDIVNYLNRHTSFYWVRENLFTQLFDLFKNYPGFLPTFIISPPKTDKGGIYQLICSTERIELDSYGATGSPTHPDFNFIYLINLSKDNYLELKFNYDQLGESPLDLDNLNPDLDNVFLTFSLIPKNHWY